MIFGMFKTVGLFGKYRDPSVEQPLKRLSQHLESKGLTVKLGHTTAAEIASELSQEVAPEAMLTDVDLAIVIGGDGTMLHVARHMAEHNIPVAGVNLGHLGFLTDIAQADMLTEIDSILQGDYSIEHRMMLEVKVSRQHKIVFQQTALNDIVIGRHALEKLIAWQVHVNQRFVTAARSDGVILCTPTGSTAYALSAGGAIMHPGTDVISMVPVSPHTLSNRPITLPADSVFAFTIHNRTQNCAHVSADGLIGCNLVGDEVVEITRSKDSAKFVHTARYDYFATLRAKLGWGGAQSE
jgi:Predicted sugar kinase